MVAVLSIYRSLEIRFGTESVGVGCVEALIAMIYERWENGMTLWREISSWTLGGGCWMLGTVALVNFLAFWEEGWL